MSSGMWNSLGLLSSLISACLIVEDGPFGFDIKCDGSKVGVEDYEMLYMCSLEMK